jgi:hypothetical protein
MFVTPLKPVKWVKNVLTLDRENCRITGTPEKLSVQNPNGKGWLTVEHRGIQGEYDFYNPFGSTAVTVFLR